MTSSRPPGALARLRLSVGRSVARLVGWLLERRWERHKNYIVHGISPERRLDLLLEAARDFELGDAGAARLVESLVAADRPRVGLAVARSLPPEGKVALADATLDLARWEARGALYPVEIFRFVLDRLEQMPGGVAGKRVVELGPGHSAATGALLVAAGVERYSAVDAFPLANREASHYRRVRRELEQRRGVLSVPGERALREEALRRFDATVRLSGETATFDETRIEWRCPADAAALPFPDSSCDLCFSVSSFEHFKDPTAAARESLRVLAPGGIGLHQIDLRDHRDFSRPYEFLRVARSEWERLLLPGGKPTFEYTNRWRRDDYLEAFRAAGGTVRELTVTSRQDLSEEMRQGFDPEFRGRPREELEVLSICLVVERG